MKTKRILSLAVMLIVLLAVVFAVSACDGGHEHNFSEWESINEPTCTSFGLKKRACECGQEEYGTTPALSHTPVTDEAVAATCFAPGKTEGSHCVICGAVIVAQTEVERVEHTLSDWTTVSEPSCTSIGLKKRDCECGKTEYDTIPALSHTPVTDEAVAASCTDDGLTEGSHCDDCGAVIVAQVTVRACGHNYSEVEVTDSARCNHEGTKRYSCTNEGCEAYYDESYLLDEVDAGDMLTAAREYVGFIHCYDYMDNYFEVCAAFVIGADGRIVASNFLIERASRIVFVLGGEEYEVTQILAYSTKSNIAVLKVNATDLPVAPICKEGAAVGDTVYTVGALNGAVDSISRGIVSGEEFVHDGAKYIQHDAEMTAGYLGAPLLNRFGEVIGINVATANDEQIRVSCAMSEIDLLDYENPITVSEYGALTYEPHEKLASWVNSFFNATNGDLLAYAIEGSSLVYTNFYYSLGYDTANNYSFVEGYWFILDTYQLYVRIIFDKTDGEYQYYLTFTDGNWKNEATGVLNAATYDRTTELEFDTYYGRYWTEEDLVAYYKSAIYDTLEWFNYCLNTYFLDIDITSFGFESLSYEYDFDGAHDILNDLIVTNGTFYPEVGSYVFSYELTEMSGIELIYIPADGDKPAETHAAMHRYTENGELYIVSLCLNNTDLGNKFEGAYAVFDGTEYVISAEGWGYVDGKTMTTATTLNCYVFNGLVEYEDAMLYDFVSDIHYMMGVVDILLTGFELDIRVEDLGFLFYCG